MSLILACVMQLSAMTEEVAVTEPSIDLSSQTASEQAVISDPAADGESNVLSDSKIEDLIKELSSIQSPSTTNELGKESLIFISSALIAALTGIISEKTTRNTKQRMIQKAFTNTSIAYAGITLARATCNLLRKNETIEMLDLNKIKCDFTALESKLKNIKKSTSARILRAVAILLATISRCELILDNRYEAGLRYCTGLFIPFVGIAELKFNKTTFDLIKKSYIYNAGTLIPNAFAYFALSMALTEGVDYLNKQKISVALADIKDALDLKK